MGVLCGKYQHAGHMCVYAVNAGYVNVELGVGTRWQRNKQASFGKHASLDTRGGGPRQAVAPPEGRFFWVSKKGSKKPDSYNRFLSHVYALDTGDGYHVSYMYGYVVMVCVRWCSDGMRFNAMCVFVCVICVYVYIPAFMYKACQYLCES